MIEKGLRADELELQRPAVKARLLPGDHRGALEEVAEPARGPSPAAAIRGVHAGEAEPVRVAAPGEEAGDLPRKMAPGQRVRCHRVEMVGEEIRRPLG